jgi:glycosyltransferase involved in cell wall biosynthesis
MRPAAPQLHVATPLVVPLPHSRWAVALNRRLLRADLARRRRLLGLGEVQLWSFLPTAVDYLGALDEALVIYYCTDEWSELPGIDRRHIAALEAQLCGRADVVFATSRSLVERKRQLNPETYLAPHGVDHAHFARALVDSEPLAPELARMPPPIVGFFGLIERWIDLQLIAALARARPRWSFVLIGKEAIDTASLRALPNVHLLGRRPYASLPGYCKGFSVGLIPFVDDALTRHVNPIKLREYLSAGVPVVSTALPEVAAQAAPGDCAIADSPESFLAACEALLGADSAAARQARSARMRGETWARKVAALGDPVRRALARRRLLH